MLPFVVADRILVDGHNLLLRCAKVPALARLSDRRGRPTGALHGTLRALKTFQEAMPTTKITVVWDGSSLRRRLLFAEYKSNRANRAADASAVRGGNDDVAWLRDTLPLLGVEQAWNDAEECDDVIASIVRGRPAGERIIIVSTDRDFLQLVEPTVTVFAPAAKSSNPTRGKFYGTALLFREYGVRPEQMVLLRAVAGDVSDNIPGVKGVGLKIAARFWNFADEGGKGADVDRAYALLRDGSIGLTKLKTKQILEGEAIVRRNVALMTLLENVPYRTVPPAADKDALLARLADRDLSALAKAFQKKPRAHQASLTNTMNTTPTESAERNELDDVVLRRQA